MCGLNEHDRKIQFPLWLHDCLCLFVCSGVSWGLWRAGTSGAWWKPSKWHDIDTFTHCSLLAQVPDWTLRRDEKYTYEDQVTVKKKVLLQHFFTSVPLDQCLRNTWSWSFTLISCYRRKLLCLHKMDCGVNPLSHAATHSPIITHTDTRAASALLTRLSPYCSLTYTARDWQGWGLDCDWLTSREPPPGLISSPSGGDEGDVPFGWISSPLIHHQMEAATGRPHRAACHPSLRRLRGLERMWTRHVAAGGGGGRIARTTSLCVESQMLTQCAKPTGEAHYSAITAGANE